MNQKTERITPFPLRMSKELREWYEEQADKNSRSLNGELLKLLTERMNRVKGQRANEC